MPLSPALRELASFTAAVFIGSSVAGWAYLLWENKPISHRQRIGGVLLSGFAGVLIMLGLWEPLQDHPTRLAFFSLLGGIGGASTIDLLMAASYQRLLARLGLKNKNPEDEESK